MSHFSFLYTGCPYFVSSSAFAMRIRRACIEHGLRMMMYRARPTMHSAVTPPPICPLPCSHTHHTRLPYDHTDTHAHTPITHDYHTITQTQPRVRAHPQASRPDTTTALHSTFSICVVPHASFSWPRLMVESPLCCFFCRSKPKSARTRSQGKAG